MEQQNRIRRGNLVKTIPQQGSPGRYLGNGRLGTVLAPFGLNAQPEQQWESPNAGRSQISHMAHWGRFRFFSDATGGQTAADYLLPLCRLYWEDEPEKVTGYRQEQDFYDGRVTTEFTREDGCQIRVEAWADMEQRDLLCFRLSVSEGGCAIRLGAVTKFIPYAFLYKQETEQRVLAQETPEGWALTVCCEDTENKVRSKVYLQTNGSVERAPDGLRILAQTGQTEIRICYGHPCEDALEQSRQRSEAAWHAIWDHSGWFSFPEARMQQMFVRSAAYLLSSYWKPEGAIPPTSGLSGNMFPFHFVQDMGYIAPALMMLGHGEIVKGWLEYFAEHIPQMQRYAKHLWPEAEGIYPPWELPFGDMEGYHQPNVPVPYCYEPHNVGYLCRMAAETAEYLRDARWTRRVAEPLIRECAKFYRSAAAKGGDGYWHLKWYPCIGQDEAGGRNKSDYLCSLYCAKYCFRAMVRFGLDETEEYGEILKDGLCFPTLMSRRGTYHTVRGADDFGKQKHPVQLVGVTYIPTETAAQEAEKLAYALRHDITEGAHIPFYHGWTLGQFLLAGTVLGDVQGWRTDWEQLEASHNVDPDWVQIYETSGESEKSFYMATHGLVLQSLIRNYVNDYWGKLEIAACPVCADGAAFGNIATRLGVTVSGVMTDGKCDYETFPMEAKKGLVI